MRTKQLLLQFQELTLNLGVLDIYLWAWYYKNGVQQGDSPNNGTWDNSSEVQKLSANGDGTQ